MWEKILFFFLSLRGTPTSGLDIISHFLPVHDNFLSGRIRVHFSYGIVLYMFLKTVFFIIEGPICLCIAPLKAAATTAAGENTKRGWRAATDYKNARTEVVKQQQPSLERIAGWITCVFFLWLLHDLLCDFTRESGYRQPFCSSFSYVYLFYWLWMNEWALLLPWLFLHWLLSALLQKKKKNNFGVDSFYLSITQASSICDRNFLSHLFWERVKDKN